MAWAKVNIEFLMRLNVTYRLSFEKTMMTALRWHGQVSTQIDQTSSDTLGEDHICDH